jgi:CDP-6-deoxy-D-xylo-4-hexulose-3-dehydrase
MRDTAPIAPAFGFKIAVKPGAGFEQSYLAHELDANKIGNHLLFGGNLPCQPVFVQLRDDRPETLRLPASFEGFYEIMKSTIFLGTYPGLIEATLEREFAVIRSFSGSHRELAPTIAR